MFFEGIRSERQLVLQAADRLSVRWYLGYDLDESLPDHSSLNRIRARYGLSVFRRFFDAIVEQCQQAEQASISNNVSQALDLLHQIQTLPGWEHNPKCLEIWRKVSAHCSRVDFHAAWLAASIEGHANSVYAVCLNANGDRMVSGSQDSIVRLWEVSTGKCLHMFQGHTGEVKSVCLSTDGRWLFSGSTDSTVRMWEVSTGRCLRILQGHTGAVYSISLSADGKWLVSGSFDETVRWWELSSGLCLRIFDRDQLPGHTITSVSLSADGRWLATAGADRTISLWDVNTGRCVRILKHPQWIMSVSLSADGRWLVAGNIDKTVCLWETSTGRRLHTFQGHSGAVWSVSLTANWQWLISGSSDNTMQIWELSWELEAQNPADWDEGARCYLENFLEQHTPYRAELPQDHTPDEQEIQQALMRRGIPTWNEADFHGLIRQLQHIGYGWLRLEGVRNQLEHMLSTRQAPSPQPGVRDKQENTEQAQERKHFLQEERKTLVNKPPDPKWIPDTARLMKLLEQQYQAISPFLSPQLLKKRIVYLDTPIDSAVANSIITQLLFLQSEDATSDIYLYINSSGGNVYDGLAIYDTIQLLKPEVATYCIGQASGFAALLLAAGQRGKRYALSNSALQLQPLHARAENNADIEITAREILRLRRILVNLFTSHTRQSESTIFEDMQRGITLPPGDAITYGLIDTVIDSLEENTLSAQPTI